jgi:hypothetical protein
MLVRNISFKRLIICILLAFGSVHLRVKSQKPLHRELKSAVDFLEIDFQSKYSDKCVCVFTTVFGFRGLWTRFKALDKITTSAC